MCFIYYLCTVLCAYMLAYRRANIVKWWPEEVQKTLRTILKIKINNNKKKN